MNAAVQIAQRRMHRAVPCHPWQGAKAFSANDNVEMALTRAIITAMPLVLGTVIADFQPFRAKRRLKPGFHVLCHAHFIASPLLSAAR